MAMISQGTMPGVYIRSPREGTNKILLKGRTIAGFVGIAHKGPLDQAVRITDFNQFIRIFGGFDSAGYLPYAVYSFFNSGGLECYVVRTAHGGESGITKAAMTIPGIFGKNDLDLTAKTPGTWGNRISIRIWYEKEKNLKWEALKKAKASFLKIILDKNKVGDKVRILYPTGKKAIISICEAAVKSGSILVPVKDEHIHEIEAGDEPIVQQIRLNISISDGETTEDYLYLATQSGDRRFFADMLAKSNLIDIDTDGIETEMWFPAENNMSLFSRGRDGIIDLSAGDFIGHYKGLNDFRGLGALESIPEISLISVPDLQLLPQIYQNDKNKAEDYAHAVRIAMVAQAEKIGNRMALIDAPDIENPFELVTLANKYDSSHAAMYYPQIEIIDPKVGDGSATVFIPPGGAVAGTIAKCDADEGHYRAPAGVLIPGAVGIRHKVDEEIFQTMYSAGINGMKRIPGQGIKIWGARTLASDPNWRYINVRRTFSILSTAIKEGMGWAVFEPNTDGLRKRIVRHVSAFLIDMWRKGYLAGKTSEEAFFIQCDSELNPPENIDAGIITTMIGLCISKPAEYIVVTLNAVKDDANVMIEEV